MTLKVSLWCLITVMVSARASADRVVGSSVKKQSLILQFDDFRARSVLEIELGDVSLLEDMPKFDPLPIFFKRWPKDELFAKRTSALFASSKLPRDFWKVDIFLRVETEHGIADLPLRQDLSPTDLFYYTTTRWQRTRQKWARAFSGCTHWLSR